MGGSSGVVSYPAPSVITRQFKWAFREDFLSQFSFYSATTRTEPPDGNPLMTDDKLYTSLSANAIMSELANHVRRTRFHNSIDRQTLDSEDDFRSVVETSVTSNSSFQNNAQPGDHSRDTNYWYSWVQIIYHIFSTLRRIIIVIGSFEKSIAILCFRVTVGLVNSFPSGPVRVVKGGLFCVQHRAWTDVCIVVTHENARSMWRC